MPAPYRSGGVLSAVSVPVRGVGNGGADEVWYGGRRIQSGLLIFQIARDHDPAELDAAGPPSASTATA